jgi:hypothetical protein
MEDNSTLNYNLSSALSDLRVIALSPYLVFGNEEVEKKSKFVTPFNRIV